MVWWLDAVVWMVVDGPNSRARELACEPSCLRVTVALPRILDGIGMSGGLDTPSIGQEEEYNRKISRGDRTKLKHELAAKCLISGAGNEHRQWA